MGSLLEGISVKSDTGTRYREAGGDGERTKRTVKIAVAAVVLAVGVGLIVWNVGRGSQSGAVLPADEGAVADSAGAPPAKLRSGPMMRTK